VETRETASVSLVTDLTHHVRVLRGQVGVELGIGAVVVFTDPANERPVGVNLPVMLPCSSECQELDARWQGGVTVTALEPLLLTCMRYGEMLGQSHP